MLFHLFLLHLCLVQEHMHIYIYIHGEKIIPHLSTHSSLLSSTVSFIPLIIKAEIAIKNKKIERKIWLNIKMEWSGLEGIQQVCFLSHLSIPFPLLRYHEHAHARQRCSFRYFFFAFYAFRYWMCAILQHTQHTHWPSHLSTYLFHLNDRWKKRKIKKNNSTSNIRINIEEQKSDIVHNLRYAALKSGIAVNIESPQWSWLVVMSHLFDS